MANSYLGRRTRNGRKKEAGGERAVVEKARLAATFQRVIIVISFGWPEFCSSIERERERKKLELREDEGK